MIASRGRLSLLRQKEKVDDFEDLNLNFEVLKVHTGQKNKERFEGTEEENKKSEVRKQVYKKQMDNALTESSIDNIFGSKIVLQSPAEGSAVESSGLMLNSGASPSGSYLSFKVFSNYKSLNSPNTNSCNQRGYTLFRISINSGKYDVEQHTDEQKESASNQISIFT